METNVRQRKLEIRGWRDYNYAFLWFQYFTHAHDSCSGKEEQTAAGCPTTLPLQILLTSVLTQLNLFIANNASIRVSGAAYNELNSSTETSLVTFKRYAGRFLRKASFRKSFFLQHSAGHQSNSKIPNQRKRSFTHKQNTKNFHVTSS